MYVQVLVQHRLQRKRLPALLADEGLLAGMRPHVLCQRALLAVRLVALRTGVRLQTRVLHHVLVHLALVYELLAAVLALVVMRRRVDAIVHLFMVFKRPGGLEVPAAHFAQV